MTFNQAITKRIQEICDDNQLSLSRLALKGGITPSVLYEIRAKGKIPSVVTLKKLCDGVNITLSEFFDRDYINEIEFDI